MHHLITLLIGLFAVSCVSIIWVRGEPFRPVKEGLIEISGKFDIWIAYLVSCAMCSGVWIGLISYVFIQPDILGKPWWMELPLWAAMVGVTTMAIDKRIWKTSSFMDPPQKASTISSDVHVRD